MLAALADAKMSPSDIQHINAHGTSTELNDKFETIAIKNAFGSHARKVAISSTKSMIGHLLGAAGAVELIASVYAIVNNIVPPTINLEVPDPECDLDYTPNKAREMQVSAVMSNSFGFGGHNASVIIKKFKG
jgi:3-oxoacyl-(acyl-carrier-protein) synthase